MAARDAGAAGAVLFALLLVAVAAFVWQGARSTRRPQRADYLMNEAVEFVHCGLPEPLAARIPPEDLRSLLEWSRYHGQVVVARSGTDIPVLGGPEAVAFVHDRAAVAGRPLDEHEVATVLDLENAYLLSIGAIGEPVEGEEPA